LDIGRLAQTVALAQRLQLGLVDLVAFLPKLGDI
jgi:hypothetical protein